MSTTINNYLYTEVIPLDVVFELTERAISKILGQNYRYNNGIRVLGTASPGMYHIIYGEEDAEGAVKKRMLTMNTRTSDAPSKEDLEDEGIFVHNNNQAGLVFTMGSFGTGDAVTKEICTTLSFLGPVVRQDEAQDDQPYFLHDAILTIEEVLERHQYSTCEAYNLLMGLKRGGILGHEELLRKTRGTVYDNAVNSTDAGSFAKNNAVSAENLTP